MSVVYTELMNLTENEVKQFAIIGKRTLLKIVDEESDRDIINEAAFDAEEMGLVDHDFAPTFCH